MPLLWCIPNPASAQIIIVVTIMRLGGRLGGSLKEAKWQLFAGFSPLTILGNRTRSGLRTCALRFLRFFSALIELFSTRTDLHPCFRQTFARQACLCKQTATNQLPIPIAVTHVKSVFGRQHP